MGTKTTSIDVSFTAPTPTISHQVTRSAIPRRCTLGPGFTTRTPLEPKSGVQKSQATCSNHKSLSNKLSNHEV